MKRRTTDQAVRPRAGQAMVEFLCGLLGIAVLVAMLLQIGIFSYKHTTMVIDTRNDMTSALVADSPPAYDADYLGGWDAGPDGRNYTQDDTSRNGNANGFMQNAENYMHLSDLLDEVEPHFPDNQYVDLNAGAGTVAEGFGIFRIQGETATVTNLPIIRKLVADFETIKINHDIYMPWIKNLLEGP